MDESVCSVAADAKLETPEGPLTMAGLAKVPQSVFTRDGDGPVRFAMLRDVEKIAEAQPVLRVTLANGKSFRVGASQRLVRRNEEPLAAGELKTGDELESTFGFPDGYVYRLDSGGERVSGFCVEVTAVEPAGVSDLYRFSINRADRFFFSAGVIGITADHGKGVLPASD